MARAKKANYRRRKAQRRRRGVILLVVLALLSLFTLMLITFVIATAHFKSSARASSKVEQTGDSPDAQLHIAFLQVVRGPRNPFSVIGAHSLGEDIYGNRTLRGRILNGNNMTGVGNGQIVQFNAQITLNTGDVNPTDGFYNGRLLTFVDGPAAGRSTRIVGSDTYTAGTPGTMNFDVLAVPGLASTSNPQFMNFIINGRPFSGTGFGFNFASFNPSNMSATRLLDASDPDNAKHLYALLPNHSSAGFKFNATINYYDPAGPGGANEDYDAPDFQNMLLAMRYYNGTNMVVPLPSLHRPDLINYWKNYTGGPKPDPIQYILRPLQRYHPNFSGSNPGFDPEVNLQGPWDVDNDGDLVPDSIWVDLGLPVQTAPDGRTYKPLFAILCIDLDGKLNLNAHGNLTQLDDRRITGQNAERFAQITSPFALPPAGMMAAPSQSMQRLRIGEGLGPPEISLHHVFQYNADEYRRLLAGISSEPLDGRYGEVQRTHPIGPGNFYLPGPGMSRICDPLAWMMQFENAAVAAGTPFGHISEFYADASNPSPLNPVPGQFAFGAATGYGTPLDLDGDGMLAVDLRGQPLYIGYRGVAGTNVSDGLGRVESSASTTRTSSTCR